MFPSNLNVSRDEVEGNIEIRGNEIHCSPQDQSLSVNCITVFAVFFFKFYIWLSRLLSQNVENNSIELYVIFELGGGRKFSGEQ